ncbi:MAG: GGDEF domain-containing protein, partial [Limnothrix sp.]
MLTHNIGSVIVAKPHPKLEDALVAVGLITEQDILQLRALEIDLHVTTAGKAMTSPVVAVPETASLIYVKQKMEEARTHRLVVEGAQGELVGLVTQSNLIEAINQNEMFKLVRFLEQQVAERTYELADLNKKLKQEVEERRKAERRIRRLSLIDELTGLYNRRGFFLLAEQELKLTEHRDLPFSLFFMDVDDLKKINDSLGHEMGDQVILDVTQHLNGCFRKADILARLGGDEFTCFALASKSEAELVIERLERAIAAFNNLKKRPYKVSISIGYVSFDDYQELSLRELIKQADEKMYKQKAEKKQKAKQSHFEVS